MLRRSVIGISNVISLGLLCVAQHGTIEAWIEFWHVFNMSAGSRYSRRSARASISLIVGRL